MEIQRLKVNYRNQMPTEPTEAARLLALWREDYERLAREHGVGVVVAALGRHRSASRFLPTLFDVEEQIAVELEVRRAQSNERRDARHHLNEMAEWKAQWERERAEDLAGQRQAA